MRNSFIKQPFRLALTPALKQFLVLCFVWWICGAILLIFMGNQSLFRIIHSHHAVFFDYVFRFFTTLGEFVVIGSILVLLLLFKFKNWHFFLLILLTQLFPFLLTQGLKFLYQEPRPFAVFGEQDWFHKVAGVTLHSNLSFPSGHTSGAFSFFTLMAILLVKRNVFWSISFFFLALLVGYSRMYLGQHFFVDVYFGSMVGTLGCLLGLWVMGKIAK